MAPRHYTEEFKDDVIDTWIEFTSDVDDDGKKQFTQKETIELINEMYGKVCIATIKRWILHKEQKALMGLSRLGNSITINECCVCYTDTHTITPCKHSVCGGCIKRMHKQICPLCRASF